MWPPEGKSKGTIRYPSNSGTVSVLLSLIVIVMLVNQLCWSIGVMLRSGTFPVVSRNSWRTLRSSCDSPCHQAGLAFSNARNIQAIQCLHSGLHILLSTKGSCTLGTGCAVQPAQPKHPEPANLWNLLCLCSAPPRKKYHVRHSVAWTHRISKNGGIALSISQNQCITHFNDPALTPCWQESEPNVSEFLASHPVSTPCCHMLPHVATYCHMLPHVATCCHR